MKLQLVILIILILFTLYISYKNYENFTDVDKQSDVDSSSECLVQSSYFYADLSNFAKKLHETFRDNTDYNNDVKSLTGKFGELINSLLLSDQSYKNMYDLNEYETNLLMFKTTMYYTFKNNELFPFVGHFLKLNVVDTSITNNLDKLKHILYYGDNELFKGLVKIFVDYVEFFTSKDMDSFITKLYNEKIIDDDLYIKYIRHFLLKEKFKDLDGDIKKIYKDDMKRDFGDNYILQDSDIEDLNVYIRNELELPKESPISNIEERQKLYIASGLAQYNTENVFEIIDYDITKCFGYYHLRNFIEYLKDLKDYKFKNNSNKRKLAEKLLDYYDKGSNNRKEIMSKICERYFETRNVFGVWDDKKGRYRIHKYGVMNRIYQNIDKQYIDSNIKSIDPQDPLNRIFKLLEEYKPIYQSSTQNIEDLVLTPKCY